MYGGANRFQAGTVPKMGALALESLHLHGPFPGVSEAVRTRILDKLQREPIEDFRLDFEDGYGYRADEEEDRHAVAAAREVGKAAALGQLPPSIGIRIKALTEASRRRALQTLELFLSTLLECRDKPGSLIVTLPKITKAAQVAELAEWLGSFEQRHAIASGYFRIELMVETPQSLPILETLVAAGQGRCSAAHFGAYDYTAALGIVGTHQRLDHPACDFARNMMQLALADSAVRLSDGAFNVMPVGTSDQVQDAWRLHFTQIQRSLSMGFYQGWDLHPAQLPARYAAVYAFYLNEFPEVIARLANFLNASRQATRLGAIFDDAATGQGLMTFVSQGLECGALRLSEIKAVGLMWKGQDEFPPFGLR